MRLHVYQRCLPASLFALVLLGCGDQRDEEQRAVARIEFYTSTGSTGTLVYDEDDPRRPLIELDLSGTQVLDAALRPVGKVTSLRKLRLRAAYTITDQGIKFLGGLSNLEALDLSQGSLTENALGPLQGMTKLESLALAGNPQFTDAALDHLIPLTRLRTLDLSSTGISDAGMEKLLRFQALEELDLSTNPRVTDKGLKRLVGLGQLQRLNVAATSVTEAGVRKLEAARPGLSVTVAESP